MEEHQMLSEIISSCHDIYRNISSLIITHNLSEYDDDIKNILEHTQIILNHAVEISIKD